MTTVRSVGAFSSSKFFGLRHVSASLIRFCSANPMYQGPRAQRLGLHSRHQTMLFYSRQHNLTTCAACLSPQRNYDPRQGKMLRKLMSGSKKKWYDCENRIEKPKIGGMEFLKPEKTKNPRRVRVLNDVLIRYVTDLIGSGEVTPDIAGRGVEITRVKINLDYTCLNIYWLTSIPEESFVVERLLNHHAGKLRSMLCNHNVIGNVPYIFFVKDDHQKHVSDVEALLAKADFGDDFTPADPSHHIKTNTILKQALPDIPELKELEIQEQPIVTGDQDFMGSLSADKTTADKDMRMDILGLNHNSILVQVQKKFNQLQARHRLRSGDDANSTDPSDSPLPPSIDLLDSANRVPNISSSLLSTSDIVRFLQQRKKLKYLERKRKGQMLDAEQFLANTADAKLETFSDEIDSEDLFDEDEYEELDGNYDDPEFSYK